MIELAPTIPDVILSQIPEQSRTKENAKFYALLKYYYDWLIQAGQPTDFIHNILEYRDIDLTTDEFREHIASSLYHAIPSTSAADKVLMTKHITEFLKSKGSLESFEFIMNAIYGEIIQIDWNSDKLFRASANEYSRRASVVIESDTPWSQVDNALLEQTFPTPASAIIESCVSTTHNGKILNWLKLNDKSVIGRFVPKGVSRALHNNIDTSLHYIEEYYKPVSILTDVLEFTAKTEEHRPYNSLIVKQLGSDFRAVIQSLVSRRLETDHFNIKVKLTNITGTFNTGELYIFPVTIEDSLYTKTDYETGVVSKSVVGVAFENNGSLYTTGDKISFLAGNGTNASAIVSDIGAGGVDSVNIIKKGYGYSVGDKLTIINDASSGDGLDVIVDKIDGIDGNVTVTTELNAFTISDGGWGYAVNDELIVLDGKRKTGTPPARLQVTSVSTGWLFKGIKLIHSGNNYPKYSKVELINSTTLSKISGFSAVPSFNNTGGISSIEVVTSPTITTKDLTIIVNGYGANYAANLSGGAVVSFTQNNVGVNYINPTVEIIGDGTGAIALPIMTSGTITGITLVRGGSGYTTATVKISEKYGTGFSAVPKIQNTTDNTGTITGLSILTRGEYESLPNCFDNALVSKVGTGEDAKISMDFRLLNSSIDNAGHYYQTANATITGNGTGAIFNPIIKDGAINSFNIVNGGTGYTYAYLTVVGGYDFVGVANISGGVITGVTIYNSGWGYDTTSQVNIIGDGINANINLLGVGNIKDGVLKELRIISGGTGYYYGTTISAPTSQPGAIQATLTPIIDNGTIKNVLSTEGEGYISADLANISVNAGTGADISVTVSGTGKIVSYQITNGGSGYYTQSEVTPISLTADIGSGAILLPVLDSDGKIIAVNVHEGGQGYTNSTIISVAGSGTGATLKAVVYKNRITDVIVVTTGIGYQYGTSSIVVGDGSGANITPVVETGITSAEVIAGGINYVEGSTTIIITDPTGTGAEIQPVISNNKIVALDIINKGTGYTNPTLSATIGSGAILEAKAKRHITDFNIVNAGIGYTYADVVIIGDGEGADVNLTFDKLGSIDSVSIVNAGTGYTLTPSVILSDDSNYGAVSKVAIKSNGGGYTTPPILILENKYDGLGDIIAGGTKFSSFGTNIGTIKGISFLDNGASYDELPIPIFPLVATLAENAAFKLGETITVSSNSYRDVTAPIDILLENGDFLLLEDGTQSQLDVLDSTFDSGTTAKVISFDYEKNLIKLDITSDIFFVASEQQDKLIITEDGSDIVHQLSASLDVGDVLIGEKSGAHATIKYLNRATGISIAGGNGWGEFKFINNVGKLNEHLSVLADNNRYQDYAYVVKAGRALKDYEKLLKTTVHPAGFALFGDVVIQSMNESNILNEIGYNKFISTLFIYSIYAMYQESAVGQEWSTLDDLFGDFTKFNFVDLSIDVVKNLTPTQTSKIVYRTINGYPSAPIATPDWSKWVLTNNIQVIKNYSIGPDNQLNMFRLSDLYATHSATLYKIVPVAATGRTYSVDFMIKKQINPLTYPRIDLTDSVIGGLSFSVVFNTETGEVKTSGTGTIEILSVGDFWYIRAIRTVVAAGANFKVTLIPAFAKMTSFISAPWTADITAIGSISASAPIVKDITGVTPLLEYVRAVNSTYADMMFYITPTETDIVVI